MFLGFTQLVQRNLIHEHVYMFSLFLLKLEYRRTGLAAVEGLHYERLGIQFFHFFNFTKS